MTNTDWEKEFDEHWEDSEHFGFKKQSTKNFITNLLAEERKDFQTVHNIRIKESELFKKLYEEERKKSERLKESLNDVLANTAWHSINKQSLEKAKQALSDYEGGKK